MEHPVRKEETPELTDKRILVYDFETFLHNWLVVIIDYESKEKTVIVDDLPKLREFYENNKLNIWVGYNSREYDQYILKGLLLGFDPWFINNEIIANGKRGWQVVRDAEEFPLYNFDISTGFHSLKQIEGFMGSMIKESDIPFDIDRPLTPEEIEQTIFYCTHDVEETMKVFEYRKEEFDSQLLMIEAFNLPMQMFTKTKAQLAAAVLEAKRGKERSDEFDLIIPDTLLLSEKYQCVVDWYKDKRNHDYNKSLVIDVAGMDCVFAWGGLHAAIPNYQAEGLIAHADVASLYPSLIIEYSLMSRNVSDKDKYKQIRERRLKLKKEKNPMQAPLKIVLNATYGCFKDSQNSLYDPKQSNCVCLAGQLLILDLVDKLADKCVIIQINTDGIFLKVDTLEQLEELKAIAREWEKRTRLNLEWGVSRKIVQKDVNNYIVIEEDGSYESKGSYLKKLSETDYDLPIVNKALIDYFIHGTPVRKTIEDCNDLREFQKIIKITSLYKYALLGDKPIKEKVHRVFASKDKNAPSLFKVKSEERIEKVANTPDHCFIFNDFCKCIPCPEELDKEYYVQTAEKRLDDFLNPKSKSKTAKVKSEIKYINYDSKSAIDTIEQTDYEYFSDMVLHIFNERILNTKQLDILAKLDYFKQFGNCREILFIIETLGFFKYGEMRTLRKDKLTGDEWFLPIVIKNSRDTNDAGKELKSYTIEDMEAILHEAERHILSLGIKDFTLREKIGFRYDYTDGIYPTRADADRAILYIKEIVPVNRKKDGKQFGYGVTTVSYGSGIETRFTVFCRVYDKAPFGVGSVIKCLDYERDGPYFTMKAYRVLDAA